MCGLAGFVGTRGARGDPSEVLRAMGRAVAHRGPDDEGIWLEGDGTAGLVHRRLAIVDLSANGHQPMTSASGRYVLSYNGEVYNHHELRQQLEASGHAPNWRGGSDTETLLAAIDAWGLEQALRRSVGMFALALWDRTHRLMHLCRDRMGEKPLYYGWNNGALIFASDLTSLCRSPEFGAGIDHEAVRAFLRLGYVPGQRSIYEGIAKVAPGEIVTIGNESTIERGRYWSLDVAAHSAGVPSRWSDAEAIDGLDHLLRQAIGGQMIADVPLGAFLSGGIDSSLVVALMQALSGRPVKTFTIGFAEDDYDEAGHARAVAKHLGTEHHELYVGPADAIAVIGALPGIYSEPFADISQIPTYLVSRLARQEVTVSLSGDAGDELFGGYNRHVMAANAWPRLQRVPRAARTALARAALALSPTTWDSVGRITGLARDHVQFGDKVHKAALVADSRDLAQLYRRLTARHPDADALLAWEAPPDGEPDALGPGCSDADRVMLMDMLGYLPDDVLTKLDRAAMAVSLETRVPFLDHRVIEFALRLPLALKIRGAEGKWILRQLLDRYIPRSLTQRPKMGFAVPMGQWLRGPLKSWAEDLLSERRLRQDALLNAGPVRRLWSEHLATRRDHAQVLWHILMLQAWLDAQRA